MKTFIKGKQLCADFFQECAKPVLDKYFPELIYSAGLLGYGSDVLGYDDEVSADHMWGPRFYLFLRKEDMWKKEEIMHALCENLPYSYKGYSVNFSVPDPNDHGVQVPEDISEGSVNPLIWIMTFDEFLTGEFGTADFDHLTLYDWLSFGEHRLLSMRKGIFFTDHLNCSKQLQTIRFYPKEVQLYLVASCWECIASEQAFVKRCGAYGDEIGSRIITARIAERLMRLCFLYKHTYAPYSKWFGTAFDTLDIDSAIKDAIQHALSADTVQEREKQIVLAQALVAELHNASGLTEPVEYRIEAYFNRDIQVIYADKFAEAGRKALQATALSGIPLIGSVSQMGGLSEFASNKENRKRIMRLYDVV